VLRTRPSPMGDETPAQTATPAKPQTASSPSTAPNASTPNAPPTTPNAAETAPPEDSKPTVLASATKPFDASSLVQRLRPATQSDLPEAPSITPATGGPAVSSAISGLNLNSAGSAPAAPAPPAAPEKKGPALTGGKIKTAELIVRKEPEYPKLARQMGVKGVVELTATIGTDGKVKSVKVDRGHPLLTKAAIDAVMQWVYRPTLLNGQPVQNDTKITLNFLGER